MMILYNVLISYDDVISYDRIASHNAKYTIEQYVFLYTRSVVSTEIFSSVFTTHSDILLWGKKNHLKYHKYTKENERD